jgi:hypothetical protein
MNASKKATTVWSKTYSTVSNSSYNKIIKDHLALNFVDFVPNTHFVVLMMRIFIEENSREAKAFN